MSPQILDTHNISVLTFHVQPHTDCQRLILSLHTDTVHLTNLHIIILTVIHMGEDKQCIWLHQAKIRL